MNIKVLFTQMVSLIVELDLLVGVIYENVFIRICACMNFNSGPVHTLSIDFQVLTLFCFKKRFPSRLFTATSRLTSICHVEAGNIMCLCSYDL